VCDVVSEDLHRPPLPCLTCASVRVLVAVGAQADEVRSRVGSTLGEWPLVVRHDSSALPARWADACSFDDVSSANVFAIRVADTVGLPRLPCSSEGPRVL